MAARRATAAIAAAATVAVTTKTVPEGLRAAWAARIDLGLPAALLCPPRLRPGSSCRVLAGCDDARFRSSNSKVIV